MSINHNPTVPVLFDALAVGRSSSGPFLTAFETRNPNANDINYPIQQRWYNTANQSEWILTGYSVIAEVKTAIWQPISASVISVTETLTGNTGGPVGVDGANNINVIGDGTSINIVGNPGTHTLTATSINGQIMTGVIPDAHTIPGTTPVVPNSSGNITVTGGQVAAGTITNVIRTDSLAANTYTIEIQRSQAVASTTIGDNGVSHYSSAQFTVDANGFVQLFGGTGPAIQQINNQVFTSNGTYTPTTNMVYCEVTIIGGGGGGGGAVATAANQFSGGGGGGAGEYAVGIFTAANIGASKTVTIGTAGAGVSGADGTAGGISSLGVLITAFGGSGAKVGPLSTAGAFIGAGGAGGTGGAGGSYRTPGTPGINGLGSAMAVIGYGGTGASSQIGSGGVETPDFHAGNDALGYGSGGNGANSGNGVGPFAGGNGTAGIVTIKEYIA